MKTWFAYDLQLQHLQVFFALMKSKLVDEIKRNQSNKLNYKMRQDSRLPLAYIPPSSFVEDAFQKDENVLPHKNILFSLIF